MTSPTDQQNRLASWTDAWPLLAAIPVFVFVYAYYLGPVAYHADDPKWLAAVGEGGSGLWQPHPFNHFRPTFYVWLATVDGFTSASPMALGLAGLLLQLLCIALVYRLGREWFDVRDSALVAAVFAIHPVRQTHWFWTSGQIDLLCIAFVVAALIVASRFMGDSQSPWRLAAIAVLAMTAALSKETAYALPFAVLLFPIACTLRTRLAATAASGLGAAAAGVWSSAILDSGGRAAELLVQPNLKIGLRYLLRLIMPFDWFHFSNLYNTQGEGRLFWLTVALLVSLGTAAAVIALVWFRRGKPWARLALVLLVWGGIAWLFHEGPGGDRSIGLGAVGLALLVGGYAQSLTDRWIATLIVVLVLVWAPRWADYADEWRGVDTYVRTIEPAFADLRAEYVDEPEVLAVGIPFTVGSIADPVEINDMYPHTRQTLLIYNPSPEAPAPEVEITGPAVRLRAVSGAILGDCYQPILYGDDTLPEDVFLSRRCNDSGHLIEVSVDRAALQAQVPESLVVAWDGRKLVPIGTRAP